MWFDILKDELTQRVNSATSMKELSEIVKEGIIIGSNGEPYTMRIFIAGSKGLKKNTEQLSMMDNRHDFEAKLEDAFYYIKYFTRSNGVREKVLDLTIEWIKNNFPQMWEDLSLERSIRDYIDIASGGLLDAFANRDYFREENR